MMGQAPTGHNDRCWGSKRFARLTKLRLQNPPFGVHGTQRIRAWEDGTAQPCKRALQVKDVFRIVLAITQLRSINGVATR
jgi:hypothetical protein